jgi:hypothetical protein
MNQKLEDNKLGGRVVGENQKEIASSFVGKLCRSVRPWSWSVVVLFVGLFIPSIRLKDKGGWFVERRNQWENIFTFLFFFMVLK